MRSVWFRIQIKVFITEKVCEGCRVLQKVLAINKTPQGLSEKTPYLSVAEIRGALNICIRQSQQAKLKAIFSAGNNNPK